LLEIITIHRRTILTDRKTNLKARVAMILMTPITWRDRNSTRSMLATVHTQCHCAGHLPL